MTCIDTHCHYNMEPLYSGQKSHFRLDDADKIVSKNWQIHYHSAKDHGVLGGIVVGADLDSSEKAIAIHKLQPKLLAAVGLHPELPHELASAITAQNPDISMANLQTQVSEQLEDQLTKLQQLATANEVIAIGEAGCDFFYFKANDPHNQLLKELQEHLFTAQIKLANALKLPLIVHTRDTAAAAYDTALKLIKDHYEFHRPFVLHCVSGPTAYVQAAIELGGYLGFDGNLTYKHNEDLLKILDMTPTDRIVVETDAPYLPPTPFRGQICEPWMVTKVATAVCEYKNTTEEQLLQNTVALFGKPIELLLSD